MMPYRNVFGLHKSWYFLLPLLVWLLLFKYIALIYNLLLSFSERGLRGDLTIVGLDNWMQLTTDPYIFRIILNTLILYLTIPVGILIALSIAMLLNNELLGLNLFRAAVFIPYITMMVAVAVIWQYIFNTEAGVLNAILLSTGVVETGISWLGNGNWALISVFIVQVWKTTGFYLIILLAGLQNIPSQLYEVAKIDGAGKFRMFQRITLPLLKPTIGVCALVGIVMSFQLFDLVLVMTGGGPGKATEILLTQIYKQSFTYGNWGYGAVLSMLMVVLTFVLAGASLKLQGIDYN
jgi:ABC-type sugar transport system permease subunit